jgi:hypothetical protein
VVVPVVEPLYEQCPERRHYIVSDVRRHDVHDDVRCPRPCRNLPDGRRGWPYVGRVALSVPCPSCEGSGIMWNDHGVVGYPSEPLGCLDCHGLGRLIWSTAEVEFVPVVEQPFRPGLHDYDSTLWVSVGHVVAPALMRGRSMVVRSIDGTFTVGQWAAVLTDVQPTTPPIPHDGGEEWEP